MLSRSLYEELSAAFPNADLKPYFSFLETVPERDKAGCEQHHILPQEEFPNRRKDPKNLIYLTPGDHLRAHFHLARCCQSPSFCRVFFIMSNLRPSCSLEELAGAATIYERGRQVQKEVVRPFGLIYGRQNVENGHLQRIAVEGGKVSGRKNVENGHLAHIRSREVAVQGGRSSGRKHVTSGHLARINGLAGHVRWHLNRGMFNPICAWCIGEKTHATN